MASPQSQPSEVGVYLERVLSSSTFRNSERLSRFLRHIVEHTLNNNIDELKEYAIAIAVFDRPASFDPRMDSVVRVEAHRLRGKLGEYYGVEGAQDAIRFGLPTGHYLVELQKSPAKVSELTLDVPFDSGKRPSSSSDSATRHRMQRWTWSAATIVLVGALALLTFVEIRRHSGKPVLKETDQVVLADFMNTTGDPVFNGTLQQAILVQLSQSPFLNIVPDAATRSTLELMTKSPETKLTQDVARQVCLRVGAKALVVGSIASLGSQYVLTLRATDCQTGNSLAQEQTTARTKEHVLPELDEAAAKLREELGESLASVHDFNTPLREATTSSLEALNAFSVGKEKGRINDADAIPFFRRAVELDPTFASAYEGLGVCYFNLGEDQLARENFTRAFELSDHLSELEKLDIACHYHNYVTGDLQKSIEVYQLWVQSYPRSAAAHGNLGCLYASSGQYERAIQELLEGLELDPRTGASYDNLVWAYANLNRFDDAKRTYNAGIALGVDDPVLRFNWFDVAFILGDKAEMDRLMAWSVNKPEGENLLLAAKADTEAFLGHLSVARDFSGRAIQSALLSGQKETAALWHLDEAIREAEFGNRKVARREVKAGLAQASNHDTRILAALALSRAGYTAEAQTLARDLARRYPLDTLVNNYWLPAIHASVALSQNDPTSTLKILRTTKPYEWASPGTWPGLGTATYPAYLQGLSYLDLGRPNEAAKEFQQIIDHRGLVGACYLFPLARLGLARSLASEGDYPGARAAYEGFFHLWQEADSDIPIFRQAKVEFAKLK